MEKEKKEKVVKEKKAKTVKEKKDKIVKKKSKKMDNKKQTIVLLEKEIFMPAMQQAVKTAVEKKASGADIISAAGNAYMNMVAALAGGPKNAAGIIQALADYLKNIETQA